MTKHISTRWVAFLPPFVLMALIAWPNLDAEAQVIRKKAQTPTQGKEEKKQESPKKENPKEKAKELQPAVLPEAWAKSFPFRPLGPANMGGRITAISVFEKDPSTFWVATSSGGLLKTINNGITFEHQFDKSATVSIGDVCVSPTDKNIVWVGTGEANPRNSVSYGDGVYKSTDGGATWKNMGLKGTFQTGKILIHPTNQNIVYVGAMGRLYGPNNERGVFKTTDGGASWSKIHFVNDKTGIIGMAMHPTDPDTLLVATWEHLRDEFDSWPGDVKKPDGIDGYDPILRWGKGSGIWKTADGGRNWKRLSNGLPTANIGRIGLDWYRKNPKTVFAIIDSEDFGKGQPPITTYLGAAAKDQPNGQPVVFQVNPNSPAGKAGIQVGDKITAAGDKPVKEFKEVVEAIRNKKSGDKLAIKVERKDGEKTFEVALSDRPERRGEGKGGAGTKGGGGGFTKGAFTKGGQRQPSDAYMGVFGEDGDNGAKITRVTEEGPGEKAGLLNNDVITEIDGKKISSYQEFIDVLQPKKPDDKMKVVFQRGKETKAVTVTLEVRPGGASRTRPNAIDLGGQNMNIQDSQGGNGHLYGGVYRSDDFGESWTRINSINPRPMYFSVVRVDPSDDQKIYVLGISQHGSSDGGATFNSSFGRQVHADGHALWVSPTDGRHMIIGTDGGVYQTYDTGANWDHFNTSAIGQFYHVDVSPRLPYMVAGGLQDNGSWSGPGISLQGGAINEDWISVAGGDGFTCRFDPNDPDTVFFTSQNGNIGRRNLRTGQISSIRPQRKAGQPSFRFNWNAPYFLSKHNSKIFYCGSQYVMRSLNYGDDLRSISPDLTLTKRGSMSAMAESPRNPEVFWAGTDDGALWVTTDAGRDWTNITKNLGLPKPMWISTIEASRFAEGRAYVAVDAHRSDDDNPYIFMTDDFGKTFKPIRNNLPIGSTRCLREDLKNENLLYCGTEFSFFVSLDRGGHWAKMDLPTVAIHEIAQHPLIGDVILATHGRSLWAFDATTLRQVTPTTFNGSAVLFKPAPSIRWRPQPNRGSTNRKFVSTNPERGAPIFYYLPKEATAVELKIFDVEGTAIRTLRTNKEQGLHMVAWDAMRNTLPGLGAVGQGGGGRQGGRQGGGFGGFTAGRPVTPGQYRVVLTIDGKDFTQIIQVEADPTAPASILAEESYSDWSVERLQKIPD